MTVEELELLPDAARTIEGLRDTGYDFLTAMADIIDNSIAAEATRSPCGSRSRWMANSRSASPTTATE